MMEIGFRLNELRARLCWFAARRRRGHPRLLIEAGTSPADQRAVERMIDRFGLDDLRKKR